MFGLTLIDDNDNHVDVKIGTRDVLKFERNGGDLSNVGSSIQEAYKLAHLAAVRSGLFSGSLSKFEDTYDIEVETEDENLPSPTEA